MQKTLPDIVITDIKMPIEDGLSLSQKIREAYPYMKVIILSGYDDFEYARKALKIGISEYLLKPVNADELLATVIQQRDKINQERTLLKEKVFQREVLEENYSFIKDKLLNKLVSGSSCKEGDQDAVLEKLAQFNLTFPGPNYKIFLVTVDDFMLLSKDCDEDEKEEIVSKIRIAMENVFAPSYQSVVFPDQGYHFILILNYAQISELYEKECVRKLASDIEELGYRITVSVSLEKSEIKNLFIAYQEAVCALRSRPYLPQSAMIKFKPEMKKIKGIFLEIKEEEKLLIQSIKKYDGKTAKETILKIFEEAELCQENFQKLKTTCVRLMMITISNLEEMSISPDTLCGGDSNMLEEIEKYNTFQSLKKSMEHFFDMTGELLINAEGEKYNAVVRKSLQFIESNYESEIRIENIVKELYITPNYFSQVFKLQTGMNFSDYLNKFRVEKAKSLLKELELKIYQVAEKSGYQNYKYFNHVFNKYAGCSPKEYRNNFMRKQSQDSN